MSHAKRNLWGDISQDPMSAQNPVVALLTEQADILAETTGGRMTAELVPITARRQPWTWEFRLVAPLADARYALFEVTQHALDFPVDIMLYGSAERRWTCQNQDELEQAIREVLGSRETRQALSSLRAIDALQGRRWLSIKFADSEGEREASVVLEPLPRTFDGTLYHATVTAGTDDVILEAQIAISGSAEAVHPADILNERVARAIESLLNRGVRRHLGESFPRVQIQSDRTIVSGESGVDFSLKP
ncbi:MAG: hypothetical protein H6703_11230 [Myxococcales bacterium]|nr:hypothetical protein [Myxococcales bacterium]MCB9543010.1 hypothetical protein [Myxococcales bacterium]MCB9551773.1 hypothetical protein [Myxococcales bacterium]